MTEYVVTVILKNLALVLTLTGALFTSIRIDPYNIWLLNLGCLFYLIWSIYVKDRNLIIVNSGLLLIYLLGLFIPIK